MSKFSDKLPEFGWKVKLNHVFHEKRDQNLRPKLKQIPAVLPLAFRYLWYVIHSVRDGRRPLMDYTKMLTGKQIYGAPIGGIGGGTIGRGFKGEFCRFQMRPGMYEYHTVAANQFIVTIHNSEGKMIYQKVLSPYNKPNHGLSSWNWNFNGSHAQYCALYPRAWTIYEIPEHKIRLICRQISPVIPHNYKDSCIPGAAFIWTIENNSDSLKYVGITMTFKNGTGGKEDKGGGCWSEMFSHDIDGQTVSGVQIHQTVNKMPCTYAVAAKHKDGVKVTHMPQFDPSGKGKELWEDLSKDGELDSPSASSVHKTRTGEQLACAVSVKLSLQGGRTGQAELALVWDMPNIHFSGKSKKYRRKYLNMRDSRTMALKHLNKHSSWESQARYPSNQPHLHTESPAHYRSNQPYLLTESLAHYPFNQPHLHTESPAHYPFNQPHLLGESPAHYPFNQPHLHTESLI
uniref:Glycosyl-hydrolase family 116 N-terminal domain-containing protein n=1 Tax=Timema cristinae TaxID=61476 RepID=A0A7R9CQJ7_TIMCR|nr:unnamed protein product [Timema cristinae]